MITKENFKEALHYLGFHSNGTTTFKKTYQNNENIFIKVDLAKDEILYNPRDTSFKEGEYPSQERQSNGFIIHRNTTTNFSSNENFVCLLCVDKLLSKGYAPKHIILEPTFKVGHNQQVYGDILVLNQNFENLILIENKTAGNEFNKEWNLTLKNGGQLFSYYAVNKTPFLCLLAYDFDEINKITYKSHIIVMQDNQEHLELINANLKEDEKKLGFDNPKNVNAKDYYNVWNKSYSLSFTTKGLLEDNVQSYNIGKEKYSIEDLSVVPYNQIASIYHDFATILRNNAIGNYENTFYILVDLFLCKIIDELDHENNLQFYYKGIMYDSPLDYCDRLLNLYEKGIEKLFKKQVVNIKKDRIEEIFNDTKRYKGALKKEIEKVFTMQKFFNIKKFNFLEVENEEEFYINFKILVQIVNLIQDFNISKSENNQFLGDLFEGFLNRSVHQTEGRFFTPTPITNFIIYSLPRLAKDSKVLDFACGAGHFLTEFLAHNKEAKLYGIEKNKDLSKVATTACIFHNFKNQTKIIFQDALDTIKSIYENDFSSESFDLIISNPPYSVKGFLSNLDESVLNKFSLSQYIDSKSYERNNAIECFFIERAKQFLKDEGILSLVLPTSILQKGGIYEKTREILLKHFQILAIVELNQRTFGSTGTQTIIIFAKKIKKLSDIANFLREQNYNDQNLKDEFEQSDFLQKYCEFMAYDYTEFKAFMGEDILSENLKKSESFKSYFDDFNSTKPKVFKKEKLKSYEQERLFEQSSFFDKNKNTKEQKQALKEFLASQEYTELELSLWYKKFLEKIKALENEKMNYFSLIQDNNLILIKSPQDNKANIVKFLGYDWSNRKGDEGIKYQTTKDTKDLQDLQEEKGDSDEEKKEKEALRNINSIKFIDTPLYNPNDKNDPTKLNYAIKAFIENKENMNEIIKLLSPKEPDSYTIALVALKNMINFSSVEFSKAISLNPSIDDEARNISNPFVNCKYELVNINSICEIGRGRVISHKYIDDNKGEYPVYSSQTKDEGVMGYINTYDFEGEYITWTTDGIYAGTCFYRNGKFNCTNVCGTLKIKDTNTILYKFMVQVLNLATPNYVVRVANPKLMNNVMANIKIPLPPLEIQKQIVRECEKVEEQYNTIRMSIEEYQRLIKAVLVKCGICDSNALKDILGDSSTSRRGGGLSSLDSIDKFIADILAHIHELESRLDWDLIASCQTEAITEESRYHNTADTKELNKLLESLPTLPPNGWEKVRISQIAEKLTAGGDKPKIFSETKTQECKIPIYANAVQNEGLYGWTNQATILKNALTVSARGTIGYAVARFEPFYPIVRLIVLIPKKELVNLKFLESLINNTTIENSGVNIPQLTVPEFSSLQIPLPPLEA
ncbi:restriction endonuclease subunit S, partial [Campylobacter sp. MIT 97-5078]